MISLRETMKEKNELRTPEGVMESLLNIFTISENLETSAKKKEKRKKKEKKGHTKNGFIPVHNQ